MKEMKRGRPRGERYPVRIPVSVTPEMEAALKAIAKENGQSLSRFLRGRLKKIIEAHETMYGPNIKKGE